MDNLKELAMLKDGFAYQKSMADLYAKKLKEVWDFLDDLIESMGDDEPRKGVLKFIKNSIPESALNR